MSPRLFALALALAACRSPAPPQVITPTTHPLPAIETITLDTSPKARRRAVAAEVFLRAYLSWFGGLAPREVFLRARGDDLFDQWTDYLAALGLPDYHVDAPRVSQSNTVMLATLGRLGEALCIRSVEHDLRANPPLRERVIFAFAPAARPTRAQFADGFDVLHRTFLGYPASLAPAGRIDRFYALYGQIAARHAAGKLGPDELGWAAVCTALVQHPETGLY